VGQPHCGRAVIGRSSSRTGRRGAAAHAAATILIAIIFALTPRNVAGQGDRASGAYLTSDHWSRAAIERLSGFGLLDAGQTSLSWPVRRSRVRDFLATARAHADDDMQRALIDGWMRRLTEESGIAIGSATLAGAADLGYRTISGARLAGSLVPREGGDFDYSGSLPAPRVNDADFAFRMDANLDGLTLAVERQPEGDVRGRTQAMYGLWGSSSVELWAGRRPLAFGPAHDAGIVLGPMARFDGVGIELPDGFVLPSFLRHLGRVRLSQAFARMDRSGPVRRPWFLATRVSLAPSNRLAIGLNRAAMFGGTGNQGVTFERVVWMLLGQTDIGSKDSDFENQVASVDFTWRPGRLWTLFGEYGFDDAGGAFFRVPGLTFGARLASLPSLPTVRVTAQLTHLARHCCGHPPWYQHGVLAQGWTDRGVLLGHPLGGEGTEFVLAVRGDFRDARLITESRLRFSHRGAENLLVPQFEGNAFGIDFHAMARVHRNVRLILDLTGDRLRNGHDRHDAWIGVRGVF
jgi:hypothetical protein